MNEADVIALFRRTMPVDPRQLNPPFTSDAEILEAGGSLLAVTVDDFSSEDGFPEADWSALGWNLAVATLSDLLAVGAEPRFLLQSVVLPPEMDGQTLEDLARGLREALDRAGAALLGGDVGSGGQWRFTGVGIGTFPEGVRPLSRVTSCPEGAVCVSGAVGDGNLAALHALTDLRFECRLEESASLRGKATACMDTSDGLARTLETLSRMNGSLRIEIDLDRVPYDPRVPAVARDLEIPREAFLLGPAGEYELLAFLPTGGEEAMGPSFRQIGSFRTALPSGVFFRKGYLEIPLLPGHLHDPRNDNDPAGHARHVMRLARELFG